MIELFPNVSIHIRDLAKYWIDLALRQTNPMESAKIMLEFINSCNTQEEKDFIDFYFNLRMEQLKNEGNND